MKAKLFLGMAFILCLLSVQISAQKRSDLLVIKDTMTGKDTLLTDVSIADDTPLELQYAINIRSSYLGERKLIPSEVRTFRKNKKVFYPNKIKVDDEIREVFLQRLLFLVEDSLSFYLFINDKGKGEVYYQLGANAEILPLSQSDGTKQRNALRHFLLQSLVAQKDEMFQAYIQKMKPTIPSYKKREYICRTGNLNLIPSLRWGVLLGGGFSQLDYPQGNKFDKQMQWNVGAFADIPLVYGGISFHPELTFNKVSALDLFVDNGDYDIAITVLPCEYPCCYDIQ